MLKLVHPTGFQPVVFRSQSERDKHYATDGLKWSARRDSHPRYSAPKADAIAARRRTEIG